MKQSAPKVKLQPEDFLEKTFSEYLACHPTYMIPLIRAHNFIMRDLGPLNPVFRHYIAILVSTLRVLLKFVCVFYKKTDIFYYVCTSCTFTVILFVSENDLLRG